MATSYLDLMKQARALAEKDLHRIVGNLQELSQHFPDLVEQAVGAITRTGEKIRKAATTTATTMAAPMTAAAPASATAAPATKKKRKITKLTKAEAVELRGMVKSALKGKVKQVEFIEKFMADHRGYKAATVQQIISDFRKSGAVKAEPVVKGNSKAGLYLMPGK